MVLPKAGQNGFLGCFKKKEQCTFYKLLRVKMYTNAYTSLRESSCDVHGY